MPYGCGEQNMINFAPIVFITQYLTASKMPTSYSMGKLFAFMRRGYQNELLYRHEDGSYSALGKRDASGSTWVTGFVLKSFAQAHHIAVDETVLESARSWLQKKQRNDGCFSSVGKVLQKNLKGGVAGSDSLVPLTSYVMISLLEAGEDPASAHVSAAAQCLKADTSQDPYTLALKAYALALGRLPEGEAVLQQLLDLAIVAKNSIHWELPKGLAGKSKSVAVETAGYAIMAMMTQDPKNFEPQARKVVKWITTQRNGQGGFYSTQDTVVALQAMAVYESHLYQIPLNMVVKVTATGLTHSITITDDNKLLQRLVTLPTLPTNVSTNLEGQGCSVIQAVLRYNIPEPEPNEAFSLTVNTSTAPDYKCVTKRITACAAYRLPDGKSNMALIQVDLISGYIPEKEDLKKLVRDDASIKRYEVDGSLVTFYMEELTDQDSCVNFRVIRAVDMEDVKAGVVTVSDYYQPELVISLRYTLPPTTECL